jgi:hypothetical protein
MAPMAAGELCALAEPASGQAPKKKRKTAKDANVSSLGPDVSPEGSAVGDSRTPANPSHVSQSVARAEEEITMPSALVPSIPSAFSESSLSLVSNFALADVRSCPKWFKVWRSCRNFTRQSYKAHYDSDSWFFPLGIEPYITRAS